MNCPKCQTSMIIELELTGGCSGHSSEDDYCYCDSPDVHAYWLCPNRRKMNPRGGSMCRQGDIPIPHLSDQYGIARWLTEHYQEAPDAQKD